MRSTDAERWSPAWYRDRERQAIEEHQSIDYGRFVSDSVRAQVEEVINSISPMERSMRDLIGELNFRYYRGMSALGVKGPPVVNVDIDLFSRRIVKGRHELMYWEFKRSGELPSAGQAAALNDLALSVDNDVQIGMAESTWSGVYVAHCDVDPGALSSRSPVLITRVIPNPTVVYMPTLLAAWPVPATLADLLGIIKHCERPHKLIENLVGSTILRMTDEYRYAFDLGARDDVR